MNQALWVGVISTRCTSCVQNWPVKMSVSQIAAAKFGLRWVKRETRLTGDFGITCCRLAAALDEIELDYVG